MNGHLEVLQWARANGCAWSVDTCMFAAAGGHLEVLQWARANGGQWNDYTRSVVDMLGERGEELARRALDENPGDGKPLRRLARRLAAGLGA